MNQYRAKVSVYETQHAILEIKRTLETLLRQELKLLRVSAPLVLSNECGLNDNLDIDQNGVLFNADSYDETIEIVQSLAKWKRVALAKYEIPRGKGIFATLNAIRPHEKVDFLHSLYVDQWDWELIIEPDQYNLEFLIDYVQNFFNIIKVTERYINTLHPQLIDKMPDKLFVISSEELYKKYPDLTPQQREYEICKEHKFVFITKIGNIIPGADHAHGARAKDYDNLELNGDLIAYHAPNDCALELMSLGIRVDKDTLIKQKGLDINLVDTYNEYYQGILKEELPLSIGGGLGQSRLCMYLLEKKHIGEVQVSVWPKSELEKAKEENIEFL